MPFSLKTLFQKEETEVKQNPENTPASDEQTSASTESQDKAEKKGKHGEPGVCCGSCS